MGELWAVMDEGGKIELHDIAAVMLASGYSRRFGEADKLLAPLWGQPLGAHAGALAGVESTAGWKFAIVPSLADDPSGVRNGLFQSMGWTCIENPEPAKGQASALKLGVRAAMQTSAKALVVLLADMPSLPKNILEQLAREASQAQAVICTDGTYRGPPALFHRAIWPQLLALTGDEGARSVLDDLESCTALKLDPGALRDVDRPGDLESLEREGRPDPK